jgi:hypothetical protein
VHVKERGNSHRLELAMLAGAVVGFGIGAVVGLGSNALDAPVLLPFVGAAAGVLVAAVVMGLLGFSGARERGRLESTRRELHHLRLRDEAHRGWISDVDLGAEAPPRRRDRQP